METMMRENADYMAVLNGIISVTSVVMPVMEAMYEAMNLEVDTSYLEEAGVVTDQIADKTQELSSIMEMNAELDVSLCRTINVELYRMVMDISADRLSCFFHLS